jgi:3-phenylpropionate/trans-cinnamate dioxygenase ferredoxin subunit
MTDYLRAAAAADVPEEGAIRLMLAGHPVCLARSEGEYFALRDVCSHAEVALSEGEVEEGTIECWLHGSRFDLRTGRPIGLPE